MPRWGDPAEGRGFRLPEDLHEQALRYALSLPGVCTAVIGFEDPVQVEEAVAAMSRFQPLSEQDQFLLYRRGLEVRASTPYWKAPWGVPVT